MSKVLVPLNQRWYYELKAVGCYSEGDFERTIRQHLREIFPDYHVFPFKKAVRGQVDDLVKKPDLAMVRRDYSAWGVIEVELAEHDTAHVLEQTEVFSNCTYNPEEITNYITKQMGVHCQFRPQKNRLLKLISDNPPVVLVVVDAPGADWEKELEVKKIDLCVFEIYKNAHGGHIFRTHGKYPIVPVEEGHCRVHATLANVVEVNGSIKFHKKCHDIAYEERLTRWEYFSQGGKDFLQFIGKTNPLVPFQNYSLLKDGSGRYYFKPA